jgi:hypothetical protein
MTDAATTPFVPIAPANEASWKDVRAVLGTRGGYHSGCWCQR